MSQYYIYRLPEELLHRAHMLGRMPEVGIRDIFYGLAQFTTAHGLPHIVEARGNVVTASTAIIMMIMIITMTMAMKM